MNRRYIMKAEKQNQSGHKKYEEKSEQDKKSKDFPGSPDKIYQGGRQQMEADEEDEVNGNRRQSGSSGLDELNQGRKRHKNEMEDIEDDGK